MQVEAFDHVNIRTRDVGAAASFYSEILGLEVRNGPAPFASEQVRWLCDSSGRAIVHLFRFDTEAAPTGPIHHIAFKCTGKARAIEWLTTKGVEFSMREDASGPLTQINLRDLDGILIELAFSEV